MFQYMFEKYQVDGVQCCIQAVLTLYGRGLMTGLVVDCGDGVTHICPVVQGCALKTVRLNLAGRDITKSLIQKLELQGYGNVQKKLLFPAKKSPSFRNFCNFLLVIQRER